MNQYPLRTLDSNRRFTKSFRQKESDTFTQASGGTSKKIDYMRQGIFRKDPAGPKQSKMSLKRHDDIPEDSNDDDPELVKTQDIN